jgi:hypothetical protein
MISFSAWMPLESIQGIVSWRLGLSWIQFLKFSANKLLLIPRVPQCATHLDSPVSRMDPGVDSPAAPDSCPWDTSMRESTEHGSPMTLRTAKNLAFSDFCMQRPEPGQVLRNYPRLEADLY